MDVLNRKEKFRLIFSEMQLENNKFSNRENGIAMRHSSKEQPERFMSTRWSLVISAGQAEGRERQDALRELCQRYWQPLYAFIRRRGHESPEAQDLTQSFLVSVLEKNPLKVARQDRGRFRSFILGCLKNFLEHEKEALKAKKRGGGKTLIAFDGSAAEQLYQPVAKQPTAEEAFDFAWMKTLLAQVMERLSEPYRKEGKSTLFARIAPGIYGAEFVNCQEVAGELEMAPAAVRQAVSRLRKKYRELLLEEIGQTVSDPGEAEEEIRHLFAIAARK